MITKRAAKCRIITTLLRHCGRITATFVAAHFLAGIGDATDVTVDYSKRFQTINGLGAMLYPFDGRYTDPGFADLFVRDFGASMARMEIVPTVQAEEPTNMATYLTDPISVIIAEMDFKGTDNNKAGEVVKALYDSRLDEFKLIATVWSPPKWMKTNNDTRHGGKLRPVAKISHGTTTVSVPPQSIVTMRGLAVDSPLKEKSR